MTRPPQRSLLLVTGHGGAHLATAIAEALGHVVGDPGGVDDAFGAGDRVVAPEPRLTASLASWTAAADRLHARLAVLLVVRHPAHLRDSDVPDEALVTAWLGSILETERATRALPRSVVRHEDLLEHWQDTLARADKHAGSRLLALASLAQVAAATELVEHWPVPAPAAWAGLEVSDGLRDLAARTHAVLSTLAEGPGDTGFLDTLHEEYAALAGSGA